MACPTVPDAYAGTEFVLQIDIPVSERDLTGRTVDSIKAWMQELETEADARTLTPILVNNVGLPTQNLQYSVKKADIPSVPNRIVTWNFQALEEGATAPFLLRPATAFIGPAPPIP